MLRNLRSRRRPRYGVQLCAVISALLLLFSVSLLYTRLSSTHDTNHQHDFLSQTDAHHSLLFSDSDDNSNDIDQLDKIDEHDTFEDQNDMFGFGNDNGEGTELEQELDPDRIKNNMGSSSSSSGYFVDHVTGSIRRGLTKRSIDEWDYDYSSFSVGLSIEDKSKVSFGSDDVPIDEEVRRKVNEVDGIEDALLLKIGKRVSPLRQGWGDWFDKKGDFLRRDRMFKSNLEVLNPMNNPLLQDPDGVGVTGLTRGDKAVQKLILNQFKGASFLVKKPLSVLETRHGESVEDNGSGVIGSEGNDRGRKRESDLENGSEINRAERRTLDENNQNNVLQDNERVKDHHEHKKNLPNENNTGGEIRLMVGMENQESKTLQRKSEESSYIYADGKRWGYFPSLHKHLSFLDFVNSFFKKGKCDMRVFMVWNSPPWMYSVRHKRGLESLFLHHRDACVVVLSETIELDFFKGSFVKDGYKVAVAMPNLDELLKDTPTHVFASVWFEWRKTKFYSTHYSELVRLAALYKYGGIYLDSDIIVLNSLSALNNTVGVEDQLAGSSFNGAVMAFRKHSPFILECLREFYMTYDDTNLRWNGADLLTRVAKSFLSKGNKSTKQLELEVQPSYVFFPISSQDITSYFIAPVTENEKAQQDALFEKVLRNSLTFHFWNSLTSTLIPEPESLVSRLIDHFCIHCSDVL